LEGIEIIASRPGQISLAIAKMKDDHHLARELEYRFSVINGIHQIEADAGAGKVSIAYNRQQLSSLRSLLALKEIFSSFFPEIDTFKLAAWLSKNL